MNYSKNLLDLKKKSKLAVIYGIFSCLLAIAYFVIVLIQGSGRSPGWEYIFFLSFLLNGITNIMYGLGYPPERVFGKAFIEIDEQKISLKTGVFQKLQSVDWKEIDSMDYKLNKLVVTKTDKSTVRLALIPLEYLVIQEIKETINTIATEKKINIR